MDRSRQNYRAYTLRLSRALGTGEWRATLYSAQTGERHHFTDLATLFAFLQQTTHEVEGDDGQWPLTESQEPQDAS